MERQKSLILSNTVTIGVISFISIFFTGSLSMMFIGFLGGLILISLEVLLFKRSNDFKKVFMIILCCITGILLILLVINTVIEHSTGYTLMIRKAIPGIILFSYAAPILLLIFLVIDKFITNQIIYFISNGILAIVIVVVGSFDIISILLGGSIITEVDFDEPDVTILLVENSFLFSSNHILYEKESMLYGSYMENDGNLTCDDGCGIGYPDSFTWTWVDDQTLVVSGDQFFEDVTFFRNGGSVEDE